MIGVFVLALTGARIAWISHFQSADQPYAENGQLDLRHWNPADGVITLDGQWAFFPDTWLIGSATGAATDAAIDARPIHVPGSWDDAMQPDQPTPFGYGSYRLRILVDPAWQSTFSIRTPSARSASALYVNGRLLAKSGEPGENGLTYAARNLPFTASFSLDGRSVIEVVVQVANYKDTRGGGIVRSMKFGTEDKVASETQLSVALQQLAAVVFLIHAGYAVILYAIGNREKKLLYFALLTFSAMVLDLLVSDEKLFALYTGISYDWGLRLVLIASIAAAFALLQCMVHLLPPYWRKIAPWYAAFCGCIVLLATIMPVRLLFMVEPLCGVAIAASILVTSVSLLRRSLKDIRDNTLLLLSLVALANSFVWKMIFIATGIKVVNYPFDLIVSTACLAIVWFKHYYQVHAHTKNLATQLQSADKMKDQFLANTSHELRNPLHGILNISQGVLEREQHALNTRSVKDLETVISVGRRMSLILNDLLDAMSLNGNAPRLQPSSFSIHSIATGVLDMLQSMREGKPVRLVNEIPETFPRVFADENRVIQIMFNLLHNALKYTNEGEIAIRAQAKDGRAHIAVSDTGIGMDEETLQRIFEPYAQANPEQTMIEGGFGLGLSICKQLVSLHGGTLKVASVPGKGSEFVFTLQLADPALTQDEAPDTGVLSAIALAASSTAAASAAPEPWTIAGEPARKLHSSADRPRILVVDDDPVNLKVLEAILSFEQYDLTSVTSGRHALDVLDEKEWDLVISDVMMPLMSGYELARTIRKRFAISELPILLLTARSRPEDIANGFQAGANEYVTKPVDAMELRSRVKALTDVKKSVRERLRMEAAWLQAQIQPHFLFNTLAAVRALSEIDLERMRNLLEAFGNFLRDKFKLKNIDEPAPIEDELNVVRSYLLIEKERYGERLHVQWDIGECNDLKVPLLTIQPLVENAIRHGIMKRAHGGTIVIRIADFDNYAEITVEDDGVGMDEHTLKRINADLSDTGEGVGLINTDLRLKRRYGKGLQIDSKPGRGTSISFTVNKGK